MDLNAPPLNPKELKQQLLLLISQARASNLDDRCAAFQQLYDLAYKQGKELGEQFDIAIPVLAQGICDTDEKIGESSLWALCYCAPYSIEPLIQCLEHHEPFVRERAAHALGNIGDHARDAAAPLRELLADVDAAVRKRGAWALGLVRDQHPTAIHMLFDMVDSNAASDRSAALHALGNIGQKLENPAPLRKRQAAILSALEDNDSDVRWSALHAMSALDLPSQQTSHLLLSVLDREKVDRVIQYALSQLKVVAPQVDLSSQIVKLTSFLDVPGYTASLACEVLSVMYPLPTEAVGPLTKALDRDELVLPAARALWKIDQSAKEILPALERIFDDYGESVCDLICELGPAAAPLLPKVLQALETDYWDLQWAAADALGKIASPTPAVMGVLLRALAHTSPIVKSSSARALAAIGLPAVPVLKAVLVDPNDRRNVWAAYALGEIGPAAHESLAELRLGMHASDTAMAETCAIAVAHVGADPDAIPLLIRILNSEDPNAPRRRAAVALGNFVPSSAQAIRVLKAATNDFDFEVSEAATQALASRIGTRH